MARRKEQPGAFGLAGFSDLVPLGRGGFSTVYRARETDTNRTVALKVLDVRDAPPHVVEMFRREAHALGALSSHPNIVTLFRLLETPDRRPVLVLELCDQSMIDVVRASGSIPAMDAVTVGVKIAGALESAHRAGILHRDIKPHNILLTSYGEPALADFGVAGLHAASADTGAAIGFTTLHAAPELLEGTPATPATDVYELASTVYHLIGGQPPFMSFPGEAPASVILRILRDPVAPLVVDGVPTALSDVLLASMAKDPLLRPTSALALAEALRDVQARRGWPVTPYAVLGQAPPAPVSSLAPSAREDRFEAPRSGSYGPPTGAPTVGPPPNTPAPAGSAPGIVVPQPIHRPGVPLAPVGSTPADPYASPAPPAPTPTPTPTPNPTPMPPPLPPTPAPAPIAATPSIPAPAPPAVPAPPAALPPNAAMAAVTAAGHPSPVPASLGSATTSGARSEPDFQQGLDRTVMRPGAEMAAAMAAARAPEPEAPTNRRWMVVGAAAALVVLALVVFVITRLA